MLKKVKGRRRRRRRRRRRENLHVCISVGVRKGEWLRYEGGKKKDEESEGMKEGQTARRTTECLRK